MNKTIKTTYIFELEPKKDGNYERKIIIQREHHEPDHDRRHNEEVENLIEALGLPRADASGKLKVEWEFMLETGQTGEEKEILKANQPGKKEKHPKIAQSDKEKKVLKTSQKT